MYVIPIHRPPIIAVTSQPVAVAWSAGVARPMLRPNGVKPPPSTLSRKRGLKRASSK